MHEAILLATPACSFTQALIGAIVQPANMRSERHRSQEESANVDTVQIRSLACIATLGLIERAPTIWTIADVVTTLNSSPLLTQASATH